MRKNQNGYSRYLKGRGRKGGKSNIKGKLKSAESMLKQDT
jgi:hypothetical protein